MTNMEYFTKLGNLIQNRESKQSFINLYKEFFQVEKVPESAIKDFLLQTSNVESYEEDDSYDSYDESYSY